MCYMLNFFIFLNFNWTLITIFHTILSKAVLWKTQTNWPISITSFQAVVLSSMQLTLSFSLFSGGGRTPKEAYSLSNCTWYKEQSCCRHTEVTSVFNSMMPLETTNEKCYNLMNYLMCFFCSPEQEFWYHSDRLHICNPYCEKIYDTCKDAKYNGKTIGETYTNGEKFCEAQLFKVVKSQKERCFDFDQKLFGTSSFVHAERLLMVMMLFLTLVMDFW